MSISVDGNKRTDILSRAFQRSVRGVVCAVRVLCSVVGRGWYFGVRFGARVLLGGWWSVEGLWFSY